MADACRYRTSARRRHQTGLVSRRHRESQPLVLCEWRVGHRLGQLPGSNRHGQPKLRADAFASAELVKANMWPMLAGVGPVLGEGARLGGFMDASGSITHWFYMNGASGQIWSGAAVERAKPPE